MPDMAVIEIAEERFERPLIEDIEKFRTDMNDGMNKLRMEMAYFRVSIIRWMFLLSIGQIGVLTGILFAFFRK